MFVFVKTKGNKNIRNSIFGDRSLVFLKTILYTLQFIPVPDIKTNSVGARWGLFDRIRPYNKWTINEEIIFKKTHYKAL